MPAMRKEQNGQRDSEMAMSRFHRNFLDGKCYTTDLDSVQYRPNRGIVALVEFKVNYKEVTRFQTEIYQRVAAALQVPAFQVQYRYPGHAKDWNADNGGVPDPNYGGWQFRVTALNSLAQAHPVRKQEWLVAADMKAFIEGL